MAPVGSKSASPTDSPGSLSFQPRASPRAPESWLRTIGHASGSARFAGAIQRAMPTSIERAEASSAERQDDDVPELPRLRVPFDRIHFARLRSLIDRLNEQQMRPEA